MYYKGGVVKMTTGEIIKNLRKSKRMTQEELANKLGFQTKSAVSKIETGQRDVSQTTILKISEIFDVSPSYILGFCDNAGKPKSVNDEVWAQICQDPEKLKLLERVMELPTEKLRLLLNFLQGFDNGDKK